MPQKFIPFSQLQIPAIRRRKLPHWEVNGATYFLTFRLADSMPAGVLQEINHSAAAWLKLHDLNDRREVQSMPLEKQAEFRRLISLQEECWLDSGHGSCVLRDPECRQHLVDAFAFFDGQRYALDAYVIMPNHVHALAMPLNGSLSSMVASWKQYSAKRINALTGQSGTLWRKETFDHIVQHAAKLEACRRYIAANPVKARLREGDYHVARGIVIET